MSRDLYQEVTDRILSQLEAGVAPWVRPWKSAEAFGGMPYNAASGKRYRGVNILLLSMHGYPTNAWMTYKQAQGLGGQVRKGEHGTKIVFFKPFVVRDVKAGSDEESERTIPMLREFTVFNVAQIDGLPERFDAAVESVEPDSSVFAQMFGLASVVHGGDRACYSTTKDRIQMPHVGQFRSESDYQATALHELTHWTGHESRLCRQYGKRFGDQAYAREELVAEMGAAFLCGLAGIAGQLQHAEYIGNWISVLKSDKRAVLVAAGAAQKAADYVMQKAGLAAAPDEEREAA